MTLGMKPMPLEFFPAIVKFIEKKMGLKPASVTDHIWQDVLRARMAKCRLPSYEEYYHHLTKSPEEIQEIVELIVIPETWFFRDRGIYDYLALMIKQKKFVTPTIKVLCLACSTGEEPYSIAMTLYEAGLPKHAFEIDAVDISHFALQKAKTGVYRKNSFRGKNMSFRDSYFSKTSSGYRINDYFKEKVRFISANLLENGLPFDIHSYQVIFCRNLLIYLDPSAQERVIELVKTYLSPDGIFTVGPAETQIAYLAGFVPIKFPGTYAFQLKEAFVEHKDMLFPITIMKKGAALKQPKHHSKRQTEHQEERVPNRVNVSVNVRDAKESLLQNALNSADGGDFEGSRQLCINYINQFGASPDVFYLLGLINQAIDKEDKAEEFFRKTIYLKPSHYEALVCLALICESKGELNQAELFRKRAQKRL